MKLIKVYDNILLEFEKLSGKKPYSDNLEKLNYEIKYNNKLLALINGYYLLKLDRDCGIEDLRYWGVVVNDNSPKELKKVESAIKALRTTIRINNLKNSEGEDEKESKINFERLLVRVENAISRNLLRDDLTVSRWIEIVKLIKDRNKEIKDIKNGRNNRST